MRELSLVVASRGHSSSPCTGPSLSRPLLLWSTGSRCAGSVVVAHGPNCSAACGIFPDQGSNPCPLHWQADSQSLRHQGSPHASLKPHRGALLWAHSSGSKSDRILPFPEIPSVVCESWVFSSLPLPVFYQGKDPAVLGKGQNPNMWLVAYILGPFSGRTYIHDWANNSGFLWYIVDTYHM